MNFFWQSFSFFSHLLIFPFFCFILFEFLNSLILTSLSPMNFISHKDLWILIDFLMAYQSHVDRNRKQMFFHINEISFDSSMHKSKYYREPNTISQSYWEFKWQSTWQTVKIRLVWFFLFIKEFVADDHSNNNNKIKKNL